MLQENLYPKICLWCKKKGIHTIVDYSEIENSHGMCEKCEKEVNKAYYGKKGEKQMTIGEDMIVYIKNYVVEDLLDEKDYEYYIDEVALAIDPTVVHTFVYTNTPKEVVAHFIKNGLVFSNNIDSCQTMAYRNMLYVTITTSKERYETMKDENYKMEAISLDNIVKWAKDRKCDKEEIINLLRRATLCTC